MTLMLKKWTSIPQHKRLLKPMSRKQGGILALGTEDAKKEECP